ncbi:hypothetical protein AES38_01475 [Clavibacter capsici]|nr:hypothetical protein AES38_01475 [Clavibacter capsici]
MGKSSVTARQSGKRDRPMVRARNVLHARVLKDTYQSERGVETALGLAGVTGYWRDLSLHMGEPSPAIKSHLNSLAARRNSVVHEGDIKRQARPRAIRHKELSAADVRSELDWVRRFIAALAVVAP